MEPQKGVFLPSDIEKWEKSEAYQDILGFLMAMNESVKGKKLSCDCIISEVVSNISKLLDTIDSWANQSPPIDQPQRYGNKAFRDFYKSVKENSASELKEHLPEAYWDSIIEICPYLTESFGNSTRIDYGTGHELAFIMFLCSLHKIGALTKEDSTATVTVLFAKYLNLCRKLQTTYKMEPAGSQGVWSLDDFQFVPFIWGSSQLAMNPKISPEMFTHTNVVKENRDEYLFLACIEYIMSVKTGPFAEHSNQLWNISAVQSWSKINQGLFKMYKAEILNKFPIIQHVLFGAIFSLSPAQSPRFAPPLGMGALKSSAAMRGPRPPTAPLPRMPMGPGVMPTGMMPRSEVTLPSAACMMPPVGTVRSEPPVQDDSKSTKGSPLKLA